MKVKNNKKHITIIKNKITDFCNDKFNINFIKILYTLFIKVQLILVRLLGFEPRTSWSVAKRSIQLSYRRASKTKPTNILLNILRFNLLLIYAS